MKPGGWIELQEFTGYIQSDHESSEVSDLAHFWDKTAESLVPLGFNYRVADSDLGTMLEKAGYVDIVPKTFKVPIGTWPKVSLSQSIMSLCCPVELGSPHPIRNSKRLWAKGWSMLIMLSRTKSYGYAACI